MNDVMSGTKRWPHRRNLKREEEMQQKLETKLKWKVKQRKFKLNVSGDPRQKSVVHWRAYPPGRSIPIGKPFLSCSEAHDFINKYWDIWT